MTEKTDSKIREQIIKVLDEEDIWEHVIMNYLSYAPKKSSQVANNKNTRRIHGKLNFAIDDVMMSYNEIRNETR